MQLPDRDTLPTSQSAKVGNNIILKSVAILLVNPAISSFPTTYLTSGTTLAPQCGGDWLPTCLTAETRRRERLISSGSTGPEASSTPVVLTALLPETSFRKDKSDWRISGTKNKYYLDCRCNSHGRSLTTCLDLYFTNFSRCQRSNT